MKIENVKDELSRHPEGTFLTLHEFNRSDIGLCNHAGGNASLRKSVQIVHTAGNRLKPLLSH